MKRPGFTVRTLLIALAFAVVVFSAHNLPAGLYVESSSTSVEIDGVNFGSFNQISGLDSDRVRSEISRNGHVKVSLKRDFVTDPSLYLWARNMSKQRQGQKDMHLVKRNDAGDVVSRYILKLCQPVSWTVEAANPALGGFHETVDVAVQDVEVH
jgi:hypothetical protein